MHLVIGNKAYSSWSLRAWLAARVSGLAFEETVIPLRQSDTKAKILAVSANGKVPILIDGDITIWESLAICEYLAEKVPEAKLWPTDPKARAIARSVCSEMHAGFAALRTHMPMDVVRKHPGKGWPSDETALAAVKADIARIETLWAECRARFGSDGPFLFGAFSIADCFYAPVVTRFDTFGVALSDTSRAYVSAVLSHPAMREWIRDAEKEPWVLSW